MTQDFTSRSQPPPDPRIAKHENRRATMEDRLHRLGKLAVLKKLQENVATTSPHDMRLLLNPEEVSNEAEEHMSRVSHWVESMRNVMVIFPIMLTWLSLALAAAAYSQSIAVNKDASSTPFLQSWQNGFTPLKFVVIGFMRIPLIVNKQRIFTFTDVALLAGFVLAILLILTFVAQLVELRARARANTLYTWLTAEVDRLSFESRILKLDPGYENEPRWIADIRAAINTTKDAMKTVKDDLVDILKKDEDLRGALKDLNELYQHEKETYEKLSATVPDIKEGVTNMVRQQTLTKEEMEKVFRLLGAAATSINLVALAFKDAGLLQEIEEIRQNQPPLRPIQTPRRAWVKHIGRLLRRQ